jgi:hypothetical protein
MRNNFSQEKAVKNAFASARMEGYRITPQIEHNARRLINGQISVKECVSEMLEKSTREKSAK